MMSDLGAGMIVGRAFANIRKPFLEEHIKTYILNSIELLHRLASEKIFMKMKNSIYL